MAGAEPVDFRACRPQTALAFSPAMTDHVPDYPPHPPDTAATGLRQRNGFRLAVTLARRPGFCCCCWTIGPKDARRARRIIKIVRRAARRGHI